MKKIVICVLLLAVLSPVAMAKKKVAKRTPAVPVKVEVSNFDFNQLTKKAGKGFLLEGDHNYGDTVSVYTMNTATIQWPTKIGNNDLTVLQDSVSHTAFGVNTLMIDSLIQHFVSHPLGYEDFPLKEVDSIPYSDANNRVLSNNVNARIKYMNDKLLVYKFEFDSYSGGAHPSYAASFINYDVRNNSLLSFKDIFKEGCDSELLNIIKKKLCEKYYVDSISQLPEISGIFVDEIFVTRNIFLTEDGVTFFYNPYDIGPWAIGVVEVPVEYYELDACLTPKATVFFKRTY